MEIPTSPLFKTDVLFLMFAFRNSFKGHHVGITETQVSDVSTHFTRSHREISHPRQTDVGKVM
jgi:hypothetical protein